jgi:hypothetical protein
MENKTKKSKIIGVRKKTKTKNVTNKLKMNM